MKNYPPSLSFQNARIGRRLWWGAIIAILLSSSLAVLVLLNFYQVFSQARQNARLLQDLYAVLEAANRISEERASSNIIMDSPKSSTIADRLRTARDKTDAALQQVASGPTPASSLAKSQLYLDEARREVDQMAVHSIANYADIQAAIDAMFSAYDIFQEVVTWQATELIRSDSTLQGTVMYALVLSDLRDSTGRLGSYLMPSLASGVPISLQNLERISRTQERILMQWQQLELGGELSNASSLLLKDHAQQQFERDGMPLIASLTAEGRVGERYSISTKQFTERYNATLMPLENWRQVYLKRLVADYQAGERKATQQFFAVLACALTIVGLISWIILVVRLRVLQPLLDVSESLVALLEERPLSSCLRRRSARELDVLFDAFDVVAARLRERADLTRQLKNQAETDPLTQLLNRRAFETLGKVMLVDRQGDRAFLILLDLDRFKSINDLHGHLEGDNILIAVADALRGNVRPGELVARIGGEEFAVMLFAPDMTAAMTMAQRLLTSLRQLTLNAQDGSTIPVTASIGIAEGEQLTWHQLMSKADVALYEAKRSGRDCIRAGV